MRHYVGLDVGKGAHWACVLGTQGGVLLSRRVEATEEALEAQLGLWLKRARIAFADRKGTAYLGGRPSHPIFGEFPFHALG
jgi:hypothetical protein